MSSVTIKMMFPVAMLAAGLSMFAGDASAAGGKKKSLLTGAAAGVAVGAVGAYLLTKNSGAAAAPAQDAEPRYTNSVRPARYQANDDQDECAVKKIDLFDRKGNFVKSEKMRVCN